MVASSYKKPDFLFVFYYCINIHKKDMLLVLLRWARANPFDM